MVAAKPRTRHEFAGSLDDNRQESNEAADHKHDLLPSGTSPARGPWADMPPAFYCNLDAGRSVLYRNAVGEAGARVAH
jgi:hypothetical protein